jgi:Carboxypeptidase regulatory-like domain
MRPSASTPRVAPGAKLHVALLCTAWLALASCGGKSPAAPSAAPSVPDAERGYSLRGAVVVAPTGTALPTAEVDIAAGVNAGRKTSVNAEGRYAFQDLTPGAMTVRASAMGYESVASDVVLDSDKTVDFTLPAPASGAPPPPAPERAILTGVVRALGPASGASAVVASARIEISAGQNAGRSTTSNQNGEYRFDDLAAGDTDLFVSATGYLSTSRRVTLGAQPTADFTLSPDPAFTTSGRIEDALTGTGLAGITVAVEGLSPAVSGADGAFQVRSDSSATATRVVTFRGPGAVERQAGLKVPGPAAAVSLISSEFDLAAFDEMFRSPQLLRWTSAPPLRIELRVLQITDVEASTGTATVETLSDADADTLQGDLEWALPQLTGGTFQAFAGVTRQLPTEGSSVTLLNTGQITVARVEGLAEMTGYWGYGRWQYRDDGVVTGGLMLIDAAFERSNSPYAQSLHAHELGHALGCQHVASRPSVMNIDARLGPTPFDRDAGRIAFRRAPGNRSPDVDPDPASISINRRSLTLTWSRGLR